MSSTQIAIDARMLNHSGIGTYLTNILSRWKNHAERLTLLCPNPEEDCAIIPEARWKRSAAALYSPSEQFALSRLSYGARLLWSPHLNVPVLPLSRLVVTVHDVLYLSHPEFFTGWRKHLYLKLVINTIRSSARRIICVSEFTKWELQRLAGIEASRIEVIPNGVDKSWFSIPDGARPHPRKYILFVGSLKPHKNLGRLIAAYASVARKIDHDFVIVGRKEGLITLDGAAIQAAEQLGEKVRFTGRVSDSELRQFYRGASAVVFPSLYEGFGLPPLEAMAAGIPVLLSDIPALREICGGAALFCHPNSTADIAEKLKEILSMSDSERSTLVEKGKIRARLYDWDECAEKTWKVVESCL
jgi:glycosyltransferase involved in cell wall biosynthesis